MNETWVLYDRMLIDDELYQGLEEFRIGSAYLRAIRQLPQRYCA